MRVGGGRERQRVGRRGRERQRVGGRGKKRPTSGALVQLRLEPYHHLC